MDKDKVVKWTVIVVGFAAGMVAASKADRIKAVGSVVVDRFKKRPPIVWRG